MRRALCLIFALAACSSEEPAQTSSPDACPDATAASCPDTSPTYNKDIAPILATACGSCHSPGGVEASVPLTTYAETSARAKSLAGQVEGCLMPQPGSPPLTFDQRKLILQWFRCGVPQD